jgi:hypothetical protein
METSIQEPQSQISIIVFVPFPHEDFDFFFLLLRDYIHSILEIKSWLEITFEEPKSIKTFFT